MERYRLLLVVTYLLLASSLYVGFFVGSTGPVFLVTFVASLVTLAGAYLVYRRDESA
ncbi:hypothetical protein [Halomarina oriensis]|uniref:Uncharacterized protein n=1 Tax=Halomarina oriensis TaxID=671145 RepID=A0A6B0GL26_9EURY|nr:hypothetical protein [Halomarina oriensis]MWG34581.1 hypothetical protein [Halomarina oriensis]